MIWRTQFAKGERDKGLEFTTPSLTRQEFKEDCEISSIIERFKSTGMTHDPSFIAGKTRQTPFFADLTQVPDYQSALHIVETAKEQFANLPSSLRARFNNDPAQLLAFVANPQFKEEAQQLGLLKKEAGAGTAVPANAPAAPTQIETGSTAGAQASTSAQ
uniref:Internal scaffolding protein n=1 Tax=Dulem virus 159 TaxID=3145636 RepID=A0AAU8B267_9VIRU